jgi:hypothetical protein
MGAFEVDPLGIAEAPDASIAGPSAEMRGRIWVWVLRRR